MPPPPPGSGEEEHLPPVPVKIALLAGNVESNAIVVDPIAANASSSAKNAQDTERP